MGEGECAIIWTVTSMTPSEPVAADSNRIKVWFRFVPREGWLPYDTEGLWATRLSADTARLENIPFLQNGVAEGEIVRFVTDADGLNWSKERVKASGNCTIRVLPVPSGPLGEALGLCTSGFRRLTWAVRSSARSSRWSPSPCQPMQTLVGSRHCSSAARRTGGGTSRSAVSPMHGATRSPAASTCFTAAPSARGAGGRGGAQPRPGGRGVGDRWRGLR